MLSDPLCLGMLMKPPQVAPSTEVYKWVLSAFFPSLGKVQTTSLPGAVTKGLAMFPTLLHALLASEPLSHGGYF